VKTFLCPRCGQTIALTLADKIMCSVCKLVIRVKGRSRSAFESGANPETKGRHFDWQSFALVGGISVLTAVVACVVWWFAFSRDN
jgi:DNA-directed RNA polymerase subunit RPC12/RpoP